MAYICSNDGMEFPTKRELIEHMHEKYNCTFLEGDWAEFSLKLLAKKSDTKSQGLKDKHAFARGD